MVQEFHVVRCFSCKAFQVHQVKKSRKLLCKLCGEKQSLIKVYGQGSAADCRHHVQKLNLLQGEVERTANITAGLSWQNEVPENDYESTQSSLSSQSSSIETPISCWSKYMEKDTENSCVKDEEENNSLIYTDPEHFYIQRNITSEARKRKKMPQNTYDIKEGDFHRATLYTSKKKRACEEWTASTKQTDNPYYITNDNRASTGNHKKTLSPATDQPTYSCSKWKTYISTEEEVKENISRTHIFQKQVANTEPTLNTFQHHLNTGPPLWSAQPETSLESESHRPVHERRLLSDQSAGCAPILSDGSAVSKPQSSIFQTDEDFDENY